MSLVLELSRGIRAKTAPALTLLPFSTLKIAFMDIKYLASNPLGKLITSPSASLKVIRGLKFDPPDCCFQSKTTLLPIPVDSSIISLIETPSTRST